MRNRTKRPLLSGGLLWLGLLLVAGSVQGQGQVLRPPSNQDRYADASLDVLVAPVALYPDDLLAIVLPAASYPLQIVQAARFLDALPTDPGRQPDPVWDDSVIALLNYPEVITFLNEDIDWTWRLGDAVINASGDVMDAVQRVRARAWAAGNLVSDAHQRVVRNGNTIEIRIVDPQVIYVPRYAPAEVVVRHVRPVYDYYPRPYPVYYYPYPPGYSFSVGFFWGLSTFFAIGWHDHAINLHYHDYIGHPYYNRPYYFTPYREPRRYSGGIGSITVNIWDRSSGRRSDDRGNWRPRVGAGARPSPWINPDRDDRERRDGWSPGQFDQRGERRDADNDWRESRQSIQPRNQLLDRRDRQEPRQSIQPRNRRDAADYSRRDRQPSSTALPRNAPARDDAAVLPPPPDTAGPRRSTEPSPANRTPRRQWTQRDTPAAPVQGNATTPVIEAGPVPQIETPAAAREDRVVIEPRREQRSQDGGDARRSWADREAEPDNAGVETRRVRMPIRERQNEDQTDSRIMSEPRPVVQEDRREPNASAAVAERARGILTERTSRRVAGAAQGGDAPADADRPDRSGDGGATAGPGRRRGGR